MTLSVEERARADRLHSAIGRARAIASRGILRAILGAYAGLPPERLVFAANPHGKPELLEPEGTGLAFNVSHADGIGLWAVAPKSDVGVDVESVRDAADLPAIAERYFAVEEREWLATVSESEWLDAFFTLWTCKEAFVKALGRGFNMPFSHFSVLFDPDAAPRIASVGGDTAGYASWTLEQLDVPDGLHAAIAVAAPRARIVTRRWPTIS